MGECGTRLSGPSEQPAAASGRTASWPSGPILEPIARRHSSGRPRRRPAAASRSMARAVRLGEIEMFSFGVELRRSSLHTLVLGTWAPTGRTVDR